jgi:hypothetical protein
MNEHSASCANSLTKKNNDLSLQKMSNYCKNIKKQILMSKTTVKQIILLTFLVTFYSTIAFNQEYLDDDKRYMKITEVSNDNTYGFDDKNPILVGSDEKAIGAYLNCIKTPDGDRLHIGNMKFNYNDQNGLTLVLLTYEQKKETTTLFFLTTKFEQPQAPLGFSFKTSDDIPKVVKFPSENILKVNPCSQKIYAVEDFLLTEKLGQELPKPKINPTFSGGLEELKKYFISNPLTDEKASQLIFRVSIAFMVTCEGKAGGFLIVTRGKGDLETYANQVLAIVNSMPQNWQSALKGGKVVDCYQVLTFTVSNGQLDKVTYK